MAVKLAECLLLFSGCGEIPLKGSLLVAKLLWILGWDDSGKMLAMLFYVRILSLGLYRVSVALL